MKRLEAMMPLLYWAKSNLFLSAPLLLAIFLLLREVLLRNTRESKLLFNILLFPGVVMHELSHATACLLFGAKIIDMSLFSYKGGRVVYRLKKESPTKNFFISSAPLIAGFLVLFIIISRLNFIEFKLENFALLALLFYFALTVSITMMPSLQDFKNSYLIYLLLISGIFIASYFLRDKMFYGDKIISFLALLNLIIIAALILFLVYTVAKKLMLFKK